jgi:sugar lactone lactonase YvrE
MMTNKTFFRPLLATIVAATSLLTTRAGAGVGEIYETNDGKLLRFSPVIGGAPTTLNVGFSNPKGLVFDGNGHLYVADAGKNAIIVLGVPYTSGATYIAGLNSPTGVAFDKAGNLYVSESGSGDILKFTPDKTKSTFAAATGASAGLAFDNDGNLYSADFSGGKIYKFSPDGSTKTTFASGLSFPAGLAFDSAGNLFEADSESGAINKFAPDGTKTSFVTGLGRPFGLAFDLNGNLIVGDNSEGATIRISPTGTKTTLFESDFNTPQFVAVEPSQHDLLNLSTRGFIRGGGDVLIAGFTIGGTGPVGTTVLVRALGPSLSSFGITDALADPVIEIRDASGTLLASNNDWKDSQETAITMTHLNPTNDRESAILTVLRGGAFTALVGSATGDSGTVVVEVYSLQ